MNNKLKLSKALRCFLEAEIRNEDNGGVSPSTIGSADESLFQMPQNVLSELNVEMKKLKPDHIKLTNELFNLEEEYGPTCLLIELLNGTANPGGNFSDKALLKMYVYLVVHQSKYGTDSRVFKSPRMLLNKRGGWTKKVEKEVTRHCGIDYDDSIGDDGFESEELDIQLVGTIGEIKVLN